MQPGTDESQKALRVGGRRVLLYRSFIDITLCKS